MIKFILSALILLNSSYALAEECKIVISGSDMMKFDTNEININKNCEKFVITLKHCISGNEKSTKDYIKSKYVPWY